MNNHTVPAVSASVETITPAIAKKLLAANERNRNVTPTIVAKYAADITAGRWGLTGEAIKISADGQLLDGQHRLHAIIKARTPIESLVVRGLDGESQKLMDIGKKRTSANVLQMTGIPNGIHVASIASWILGREKGLHATAMSSNTTSPTHAEILEFAAIHGESLQEAIVVARGTRSAVKISPTAAGAAYWVLSGIDAAAADQFFWLIRNFRTDGPGDPVHALLRRLQASAPGERATLHAHFVFRSWNAWRKGEQLHQIKVTPTTALAVPI